MSADAACAGVTAVTVTSRAPSWGLLSRAPLSAGPGLASPMTGFRALRARGACAGAFLESIGVKRNLIPRRGGGLFVS